MDCALMLGLSSPLKSLKRNSYEERQFLFKIIKMSKILLKWRRIFGLDKTDLVCAGRLSCQLSTRPRARCLGRCYWYQLKFNMHFSQWSTIVKSTYQSCLWQTECRRRWRRKWRQWWESTTRTAWRYQRHSSLEQAAEQLDDSRPP